jgi:hypothetical protein
VPEDFEVSEEAKEQLLVEFVEFSLFKGDDDGSLIKQ